MSGITAEQYAVLTRPLNATRVAKRNQGGKELSYLEAWDVRAHLIRCFGFGNFDAETIEAYMQYQRDVEVGQNKNPGWEVAWFVRLQLTIRDRKGVKIASYCESAVGSATGSVNLGDLHDNALKQAASDALKRCAINLGTQFGLSLYDNGNRNDVVKRSLVIPKGVNGDTPADKPLTEAQTKVLQDSLGAEIVSDEPDKPEFTNRADTPEQAAAAVKKATAKAGAR